ncbi:MAG: hypothetical protein K2H67_07460 [Treponemataceae bacterium]|nr:hypothetical protein [Treponemataceae bacterium]
MQSSPIEFVSAADLSNLNITSILVKATKASYTGESTDTWSFKIYTSASWENEIELKWSADINGYKATISDENLEKFKSSGIFVYGWPTDIKATVTVSYE